MRAFLTIFFSRLFNSFLMSITSKMLGENEVPEKDTTEEKNVT